MPKRPKEAWLAEAGQRLARAQALNRLRQLNQRVQELESGTDAQALADALEEREDVQDQLIAVTPQEPSPTMPTAPVVQPPVGGNR